MKASSTDLWKSDLFTSLGLMAASLCQVSASLMGLAHTGSSRGDEEFRTLEVTALSLDEMARTLEAIRPHLCRTCRLIGITRVLMVGKAST